MQPSLTSKNQPTQTDVAEVVDAKDAPPVSARDETAKIAPASNDVPASGSSHNPSAPVPIGRITRFLRSQNDTILSCLMVAAASWTAHEVVQHSRLYTELRSDAEAQKQLLALRLNQLEKKLETVGSTVENSTTTVGRIGAQIELSNSRIDSLNKRLDELPEIRSVLMSQAAEIGELKGRSNAAQK
ncbi:hypothetical protein [Sorangium sp. So ce406]|uniref:hypothetical protein n=1 Tax=Sorangium sp. So ce406 TaxID=3133311 RepID=UPI003F5CA0A2